MVELNPYDWTFHEDPYPTYKAMRDEAPVYRNDKMGFWALSRHADVQRAFKDWKTYSNEKGVALEAIEGDAKKTMSIIAMDPPIHNDVRKVLVHVFTSRQMANLEPSVRAMAIRYAQEMKEKTIKGEPVDFVEDFAGKIPMDVISDMIGVPEKDRDKVRDWANHMMDREDGKETIPPHAMEASMNLIIYFHNMVKDRRANGLGDDLTAQFMQAEVEGYTLQDDDIVSFLFLMSVAGNETTTKLLANALYWGKKYPDQLQKVYDDAEKIPNWVEETLRFDNSSQIVYRTLTQDYDLRGHLLKKDDRIALLIGAANRDERAFSNPDIYDIERDCGNTLSFGKGVHFCLGAQLARLEGQVCLEEFLRVFKDYSYQDEDLVRIHSGNVRGFLNMPIQLELR